MRTIKLPHNSKEIQDQIIKIQEHSSKIFRLAYNRFWEDKSEKEIRDLSKKYNHIELLDSWYIQCAIKKAQALQKADKEKDKKTCFGGYKNFKLLCDKKLNKEKFTLLKLSPIFSQGEAPQKGNRKFQLDMENNQVIFKYKKGQVFLIKLPKLRKELKNRLIKLERVMKSCKYPVSFELTHDSIYITYDEKIFINQYQGKQNIVAGVDLNPNYIGFTISKFDNDKQEIIFKQAIDLSYFTKNLRVSSSDNKSKKQTNKQRFELTEISKYIVEICKKYNVSKFVVEDLNMKSEDKGRGKNYNRLCNNKWNRNLLLSQLEKRCNINNITFVKINPCYTSYLGNILHNEFDPVAASIEIVRRGHYSFKIKNKTFYKKDKFYPALIHKEDLGNRWKEALDWVYESWKELCNQIKTSKLKYRHSLDEFSFKVYRFRTDKSFIKLYSFI